jgi:TonB family protein
MAELSQRERLMGCAPLALVWALLWAPLAHAQADASAANLVNLDRKAVSKLQIKIEPPAYPAVAKVNYIQGKVRLRIFVSSQGRVTNAHILKGHPFLAAAAMEAVRNWVYRPYRVGKQASEFTTLVSIHFTLRPKVLTDLPPSAERDLEARIEPPRLENEPADPPTDTHVRLRVLVDSEGHALDTQRVSGNDSDARAAEQEVTHWRFRPAHWGTLPVPWYLEVDVPVRHDSA